MGSNAKKITVNCGTTHVSVSVFSEKAGSLVLEKLIVEELVYDYTAEEEWAAAASGALSGIFKRLKLKEPATIIAPGHLILTKNVKVPQVEASRQRQIIAFEAADKFPFPLGELVWDSQIISTDGVEAEVVLFAMKRENAERFAMQMVRSGITPEAVQPSTNLDYQAYRFLNGEETENVLIVNVGARTTNLTFVTPDGFSIQNIAVGGNFLTQAIADSLGKPFAAAERLKVNYFSDAVDVAEDDPHVLKLKENAHAFCRRLGQEITRRIVNQKRQNAKGAPTKILLTGRGSLLPGLSESLAESQHLPVEYFEPTVPVRVGPYVDSGYFDSVRFQLSEVIGDASELLDSSHPQVNLIPPQIAAGLELSKKKPFFIAAAVLFALAPWPALVGLQSAGTALKAENSALVQEKNQLNRRLSVLDDLEKTTGPEKAFVQALDGVLDSRDAWTAFLADVQARIDSLQAPTVTEDGEKVYSSNRHVWVESLSVSRDVRRAAAAEGEGGDGEASAPVVRTEVLLRLRLLIPEVDGASPGLNSAAFNARRRAVLDVFRQSEYVERLTDQTDVNRPNFPTITLKLVLKQDKGI